MTRVLVRLALVVALTAALVAVRAPEDAEHPPHAFPPISADPLGLNPPDVLSVVADARWVGEREQERLDQVAEAERLEAARRLADIPVARPGTQPVARPDCGTIPDWFPHAIAWRESNCTRGIDTGNGYYGYAQVAGFHWFGGICDGLTWTIPAQEDECVWRLSAGGTNLRPWGA